MIRYYYEPTGTVRKTAREWRLYMVENNIEYLRVYEAKIAYKTGWCDCSFFEQLVRTGKNGDCNRSCPAYDQNKGYRCKSYGYEYRMTDNEVILSQKYSTNIKTFEVTKKETKAIQETCAAFGVTENQLMSRVRKTEMVHARHFLILLFVLQYKHAIKATSDYFSMNQSIYYHALYTVAAEYETYKTYRQKVNALLERLGISYKRYGKRLLTLSKKYKRVRQYA